MEANEGRSLSSRWGRPELVAFADRLVTAVRPYASPGHSMIVLPGPEGGYGRRVDGLEGFARTFLLAGFRLAGERGADPDGLADWYAQGLATGTDPSSPERWLRMDEHPQAKVEAASIALVLDLTRPWIWDRLDPVVQERVVVYLSHAVGDDTYPRINWVWFRLVVQTFLRSVGGPFSLGEMAEDLATHDGFARAGGWMADGRERSYDHYVGWALHVYPTLWGRMVGAEEFAAPRREHDTAMLDRYLTDAIHLVGGDGSPLIEGRSLAYRFAAAAPFWTGVIAGVPSVPAGQLRRAATRIVQHFAARGVPDDAGLLSTGWFRRWQGLAQAYSGPGSPYWASKGLLGIALPADHPVWEAPEIPLPVERADTLRVVEAPAWIVSGTREDGLVRVINHGTDHAEPGAMCGDSPLYARLGYSTATFPLLDVASWVSPVDQSVTLLDADGIATHRAGMEVLDLGIADAPVPIAWAASRSSAHWLDPDPVQQNHGYGYTGEAHPAGVLTVVSLVRDRWEVRLVRIDSLAGDAATTLRIGGWPVSGDESRIAGTAGSVRTGRTASVSDGWLVSRITGVLGDTRPGIDSRTGASPLGEFSCTPWTALDPVPGVWVGVLIEFFASTNAGDEGTCTVEELTEAGASLAIRIQWPDGVTTDTRARIGRSSEQPTAGGR